MAQKTIEDTNFVKFMHTFHDLVSEGWKLTRLSEHAPTSTPTYKVTLVIDEVVVPETPEKAPEAPAKETPPPAPVQEASTKETPAKETPAKETPAKETTPKKPQGRPARN